MITAEGDQLYAVNPGRHNMLGGPDFLYAHIKIGGLDWYGSVEFHLKGSDWYAHKHHLDSAYNNVILHLVWEDDVPVYTQEGTKVYTCSVHTWIHKKDLNIFSEFFKQTNDEIVCANQYSSVNPVIRLGWKERLFVGRLEKRIEEIEENLAEANQDWEAVFFWYLAKGFGLNHNGTAFFEAAKSLPFSVVRKCSHKVEELEALFMGQSGLLNEKANDPYFLHLKKTYAFLKHKYSLKRTGVGTPHFARIRPSNFPTLRWAQLAQVYAENQALFSDLMKKNAFQKLSLWRDFKVSRYWMNHYNFGKTSPKRSKRLTLGFLQLLEINVVLPFYYFYHRSKGKLHNDEIMDRMRQLPPEKNSITQYFKSIGGMVECALDSQAYISLKKEYCDLKKCLLCAVGQSLLK